jgi:hypothetical protein
MTSFATPEPGPQLVAEIEDFFDQHIDWDELALEITDDAPNADASFDALLAFAPHLGLL